jgi:hypothetical protein
MHSFKAELKIIGINPFVFVPEKILLEVFQQAGKNKGHIPIKGIINGNAYKQTLVRYSGDWRLYVNTTMLKNSPKRIGEIIELTIAFDPESRKVKAPSQFLEALKANPDAKTKFESLSESKKNEITRYLANLKTEETLQKNVIRAIDFLLGKGRFVGRDNP